MWDTLAKDTGKESVHIPLLLLSVPILNELVYIQMRCPIKEFTSTVIKDSSKSPFTRFCELLCPNYNIIGYLKRNLAMLKSHSHTLVKLLKSMLQMFKTWIKFDPIKVLSSDSNLNQKKNVNIYIYREREREINITILIWILGK